MQSLIRSKSAGVTGGRGTAGAGPGRDLRQPRPLGHVRAPKVQRQVQVQALLALALLVPQAPSSRRCPPSLCPYSHFLLSTFLGALGVRHGVAAGKQRLSASCYQKVL